MIRNYHFRNDHYELYLPSKIENYDNIFSILVGKNGTGKSSFLGDLTQQYIKRLHKLRENKFHFNERLFKDFPRQIIAVSTSPFDKFPVSRWTKFEEKYTYLGLRDLTSTNFGLAYLSKLISSLIESVSKKPEQAYEIGKVLNYLGYKDEIWVEFNMTTFRNILDEVLSVENPYEYFKNSKSINNRRVNKGFFFSEEGTLFEDRVEKLIDISESLNNSNNFDRFFNLSINSEGISINHKDSEDLLFLVSAGILRLKDVILQPTNDYDHFSIKDASSGEQSIILSILGIASKIEDNCLICIDEPEICLHPQWQEKYIEILTSTFQNYKGCHFIIATHSPQIISKLNLNSFIISMENKEIKHSNEFRNHSADFQLAKVFDSPGYKNEYLSRIALNVFAKVSKRKKFDEKDIESFKILNDQSEFLEPTDPVYSLYNAIKDMYEIYGGYRK